jgi:flotillin
MLVSEAQKISLEVMTLLPKVSNCETKKGVPITVTGVAQVKVMTDDDVYLQIACEQFLGKEDHEIQEQLLETFEGTFFVVVGQHNN